METSEKIKYSSAAVIVICIIVAVATYVSYDMKKRNGEDGDPEFYTLIASIVLGIVACAVYVYINYKS